MKQPSSSSHEFLSCMNDQSEVKERNQQNLGFDPFATSTGPVVGSEVRSNRLNHQEPESSNMLCCNPLNQCGNRSSSTTDKRHDTGCGLNFTNCHYDNEGEEDEYNDEDNNNNDDDDDREGLELLQQIFPDLDMSELKKMHRERINNSKTNTTNDSKATEMEPPPTNNRNNVGAAASPAVTNNKALQMQQEESLMIPIHSPVGKRIIHERHSTRRINNNTQQSNKNQSLSQKTSDGTTLPYPMQQKQLNSSIDDRHRVVTVQMDPTFLRVPMNCAVPITSPITGRPEWKRIDELQHQILHRLYQFDSAVHAHAPPYIDFTRALRRCSPFGLGFTIREQGGMIFVLNLAQPIMRGNDSSDREDNNKSFVVGPAQNAGIAIGDRVLGVNGMPFTMFPMMTMNESPQLDDYATHDQLQSRMLLNQAGQAIVNTPDPVVLHVRRYYSHHSLPQQQQGSNNFGVVANRNNNNPLLSPLPRTIPPLSSVGVPSSSSIQGQLSTPTNNSGGGLFSSPVFATSSGSGQGNSSSTPFTGLFSSGANKKERPRSGRNKKTEQDIISEHMGSSPSMMEDDLLGEQELLSTITKSSTPKNASNIAQQSDNTSAAEQPVQDFLSGNLYDTATTTTTTDKTRQQPPTTKSNPRQQQQQPAAAAVREISRKRPIHPFAKLLRQKDLLTSINPAEEERQITALLHRFTVRARQWETKSSFRLNSSGNVRDIFDPRNLPSWAASEHYATGLQQQKNDCSSSSSGGSNAVAAALPLLRPFTPSTPPMRVRPEYLEPTSQSSLNGCGAAGGHDVSPNYCSIERTDSGEEEQQDVALASNNNKSSRPLVSGDNNSILSFPATKNRSGVHHGPLPSSLSDAKGKHTRLHDHYDQYYDDNERYIPLMGCRKALCIRIVNYFVDGDRVAYTIWVYDAESEREWYAPVRYLRDFRELHQSTSQIAPSIGKYHPFPASGGVGGWARFTKRGGGGAGGRGEARDTESQKEQKCQQLEGFLRFLSGWIYTTSLDLNERTAEVAIHLQSFLGCDSHNLSSSEDDGDLDFQGIVSKGSSATSITSANISSTIVQKSNEIGGDEGSDTGNSSSSEQQRQRQQHTENEKIKQATRIMLRRAIQRYTFRLFLLPAMQKIVQHFVSETRSQHSNNSLSFSPGVVVKKGNATLGASISAMDSEQIKDNVLKSLDQLKQFLDELQSTIFEGCREDFIGICSHRDYSILNLSIDCDQDDTTRDVIINEGIREQLEIEVYVPLRSVVSKKVVNGWKQDDQEMSYKMQILRTWPQSRFKINKKDQSLTEWNTVSRILREGVGRSTLPCVKLRAIVESAKEVIRLHNWEHKFKANAANTSEEALLPGKACCSLGADDFLPIFIFCVVKAELERPCALAILLTSLCQASKMMGETGYYLASFEAALEHIKEIDLNEYST